MLLPAAPSSADLSRALGLAPSVPLAPKPGTPRYYARLVSFDAADTLRSLGLPCAARVASSATSPDDWRDVALELGRVADDEMRRHDVAALKRCACHMAEGCAAAAATDLQRVRGLDTLEEWSATVRAEMMSAGVSL